MALFGFTLAAIPSRVWSLEAKFQGDRVYDDGFVSPDLAASTPEKVDEVTAVLI
jgi:hypothetical protein